MSSTPIGEGTKGDYNQFCHTSPQDEIHISYIISLISYIFSLRPGIQLRVRTGFDTGGSGRMESILSVCGGMSRTNSSIIDIDADGDLDYFIGEYSGYIKYFRNDGTSTEPLFIYACTQFDSIYLEEAVANQCFVDIDNDNDYDIVVSDNDPHVHLYRNIGTPQIPDYIHETSTLVPYQSPWCRGPELADIDADGDYDLFGGNHGQISFFINTGTPDSFCFELNTGTFAGINVGDRASPRFIDIDGDNDLDLFIGYENGYIWYYRNDGDSAN